MPRTETLKYRVDEKEKVELLEKFTPYAERLAFYRGVI